MLRCLARPVPAMRVRAALSPRYSTDTARKVSDPLRILFCGSDAFSCESLQALHREHIQNKSLVESLDVMVLPPKKTGRGLKQMTEVPCKEAAEKLALRVHQRETFTKWELPQGINLIIAVSFGLFIPPRILGATKYGGLNVHPSLLPDLRGPAPIHHAMLRGDKRIGISLQTLDDKNFDHGTILAQTPAPGHTIPPRSSVQEVTSIMGLIGSQMLVQGLRDGLHVAPHRDAGWMAREAEGSDWTHAPKVTRADAQVDWARWTAQDFGRRMRVFNTIWTKALDNKGGEKRIVFQDLEVVSGEDVKGGEERVTFLREVGPGEERMSFERVVRFDETEGSCAIQAEEDVWLRMRKVKVDGKPERAATSALRAFRSGGVS